MGFFRLSRKYNVKKDLDNGFDEILVVALDRKTRDRIENELRESNLSKEERIKIMHIGELFASSHV